jgi:hypothetical protein
MFLSRLQGLATQPKVYQITILFKVLICFLQKCSQTIYYRFKKLSFPLHNFTFIRLIFQE